MSTPFQFHFLMQDLAKGFGSFEGRQAGQRVELDNDHLLSGEGGILNFLPPPISTSIDWPEFSFSERSGMVDTIETTYLIPPNKLFSHPFFQHISPYPFHCQAPSPCSVEFLLSVSIFSSCLVPFDEPRWGAGFGAPGEPWV